MVHGDGNGPRAPPRCPGVREKFKVTNFTTPNNFSSMKYSLKSVPGSADGGVPMGLRLRPDLQVPRPDRKI